jgi:hypothetical protein
MQRLLTTFLVFLALPSFAAEPAYSADVSAWKEYTIPPASNERRYMAWNMAANESRLEWRVFTQDGRVKAARVSESSHMRTELPPFVPDRGHFDEATRSVRVDDGWLVGLNHGEFGASLDWYDADGRATYKISEHQIVDFLVRSDGLYAIEGLAHLGMSEGSLIKISRPDTTARWQAQTVVNLPFAPYAFAVKSDGALVITLSDAIVIVRPDNTLETVLAKTPWSGLYPRTSVLSQDEKILYIGMRQYVAEVTLSSKSFRLLLPSDAFLNTLSKTQEDYIRKVYRP